MATNQGSIERQKAELTAALAVSRREISGELEQVAEALDVTSQFRRSFRERSWEWLAGSLAVGAVAGLALMPRKGRRGKALSGGDKAGGGKRSVTGFLLKFALQNALVLAQPTLTRIAREQVERLVNAQLRKS